MVYNRDFLNFLLKKASALRENAAYGGRMDDGGADDLETQVAVYRAAINGQEVTAWTKYYKEFNTVSDPEYETYLRLKKKFD